MFNLKHFHSNGRLMVKIIVNVLRIASEKKKGNFTIEFSFKIYFKNIFTQIFPEQKYGKLKMFIIATFLFNKIQLLFSKFLNLFKMFSNSLPKL